MAYFTIDQVLNQVANAADGALVTEGAIKNVTLFSGTTPAAASTVAQTAVTGLGGFNSMQVYASLIGATGGTLDIYLQYSPDGGTTWVDYVHYAQLAAGASALLKTFAVTKDAQQTTLTTVGSGTTPALAAATVVGGDWGDRLRVVTVAGTSTSAGAVVAITAVLSS